MHRLLGSAEAQDLFFALAKEPVAGLRVNTLKLSTDSFQERSSFKLSPISWTASGFIIEQQERAGKHPFHEAGLYYLQEPSAMAVAEALSAKPGDWVIDLAAAQGGKSTQIASDLQNKGLLVTNELNRKRSPALLENLERWGCQNALITSAEISHLAATWGARFDKVLLDAPCSGEGMFRKSEDALKMWSEQNVHHCALRQNDLLSEAAKLVKPEGYLVYSTCTFAPEENEGVIDAFLHSHPEFRLEPIKLPELSQGRPDWTTGKRESLSQTARLWPHRHKGEGHFLACLKKYDGYEGKQKTHIFKEAQAKDIQLWQAFSAGSALEDLCQDKQFVSFDKRLFALPKTLPQLDKVQTLRAGLFLGWLEKNRFEPAHALALALSSEQAASFKHLNLKLDDPRLYDYLQGQIIEAAGEAGWLLVCAEGFPLGWGKRSGDSVKNNLPKGLRWR